MNRKRLDAEALKDSLLWHRGQVRRAKDDRWSESKRSLFAAPTRSAPDALSSLFDGPDPHLVVPRRADSTSAPQSLFMMNNDAVLSTAKAVVSGLLKEGLDEGASIEMLYRRLVGRLPTGEERRLASQTLNESREVRRRLAESGTETVGDKAGPWEDLCMSLLCSNEFIYVE